MNQQKNHSKEFFERHRATQICKGMVVRHGELDYDRIKHYCEISPCYTLELLAPDEPNNFPRTKVNRWVKDSAFGLWNMEEVGTRLGLYTKYPPIFSRFTEKMPSGLEATHCFITRAIEYWGYVYSVIYPQDEMDERCVYYNASRLSVEDAVKRFCEWEGKLPQLVTAT